MQNGRLPSIVEDFIQRSDYLHKIIDLAAAEIITDIQNMLYDSNSKSTAKSNIIRSSTHVQVCTWLDAAMIRNQNLLHVQLQETRADNACSFVLRDGRFRSWYSATDSQQLVLLGEMGCGKSVTMAFLIDELGRRRVWQMPEHKICYFYCLHDTGKATQIVSGLIFSLLEQFRGLKKDFCQWYSNAQSGSNRDPSANLAMMEGYLQKVLQNLDRTLFIIIDGLDECHRDSLYRLLKYLKKLLLTTPRLKILLSSRPQGNVLEQLGETPQIYLQSDPTRDRIIAEKMVDSKLYDLTDAVKSIVIDKLSDLAHGSAIWMDKTVQLIADRKITTLPRMKHFLENMHLPKQLSELYEALLTRRTMNDEENITITWTALKLLAVSRRPLSIEELAWATALVTSHETCSLAAVETFVDMSSVIGLVEPFITCIDTRNIKKRQVRLVHMSVREFILSNHTMKPSGSLSSRDDRKKSAQCIQDLEEFVLDICVKYLLLDEINSIQLFSEGMMIIQELPIETDIFSDDLNSSAYDANCSWDTWEETMTRYDPTEHGFGGFFTYSSCYWIAHFGAVSKNHLPSLLDIEKLCQVNSLRLQNWIKQNCRPNCTVTERFEFDSTLYDPLSITSLYGSEDMLRHMVESSSFSADTYLQRTAMAAVAQILRWGDLSRLRILFQSATLGIHLQTYSFFKLVLQAWRDHNIMGYDNWEPVFYLVDDVLDKMVEEKWANELLSLASDLKCTPLVGRLISKAQERPELREELLRPCNHRPL